MSNNERNESQEFDFSKEIENPIEVDTASISESVKTFAEKSSGMEEMEYYEDEPEASEEGGETEVSENAGDEAAGDNSSDTIRVNANIMDTSKIIHRPGNSGVVQDLELLPTDSIRIPAEEVEKKVEAVSSQDESDIHEVTFEEESSGESSADAEEATEAADDDYPDEELAEDTADEELADEVADEEAADEASGDASHVKREHQSIELLPEDELDDDVPLTEEEAEALGDLSYHDEDVKRKKKSKNEQDHKKKAAAAAAGAATAAAVATAASGKYPSGDVDAAKHANGKKHAPSSQGSKQGGSHPEHKKKAGVFDVLLIVGAVAAIVIICILTISFITRSQRMAKTEKLASVGNQLTMLGNVGEKGINEIVANKMTTVVESVSEEPKSEKPSENKKENKNVSVNFSSVEKDLKIKFSDKQTDTLIKGVLFRVEARTPDGKTVTWEDTDKDGIICMDNLTPGKYYVKILNVEDYVFPETESEVTVKDKISYTAINIVNEIKKEKDINVAAEDKKAKNVDTGVLLQDTVGWVDSAKKEVYTEIPKDKIPEPQVLAMNSKSSYNAEPTPEEGQPGSEPTTEEPTPPAPVVHKVTSVTISEGSKTMFVGDSASLSAQAKDEEGNGISVSYSWSSGDPGVVTVDGNGALSAKGKGSTSVTCVAKDENGNEASATCSITVNEVVHYVTGITVAVNPGAALKVGETAKITANVTTDGAGVDTSVNFASSNNGIATVAADGTIQAKAEGTAIITVSSNGKKSDGNPATATVTISVEAIKGYVTGLTLDKQSVTVGVGKTAKITASVSTEGGAVDSNVYWSSSDENIALVGIDGTVVGKAKGSAVITCKTAGKTKDGKDIAVTCTVTVNSAMDDTTTTLTYRRDDGAVFTLFVKDGENYREAKYADYYTYNTFYIKENKLFGWQNENGNTRYYNSEGKYVTGEQVIGGVKYNFASDGTLSVGSGTMGIDVSKWNGSINWNAVKQSGVSFVIIRCGYRGCTQGGLIEDPNFHTYASGAEAAGLKVGVYFFSQAINEREAVEEASMAISMAQRHRISYPIFIDSEYGSNSHNARADGLGKAERTAICRAFCETIRSAGYTSGVYASKSWFYNKLDAGSLNNYKIWLAHYCSKTDYTGKYELWQSSSTGRINGISGNVDINTSYLGY